MSPRPSRLASLDLSADLKPIVEHFVAQISGIIEQVTAERIRAALNEQFGIAGVKRGRGRPSKASLGMVIENSNRRKITRACPVPGCARPGRGPRFRWLCDQHRGMSRDEWLKLKAHS